MLANDACRLKKHGRLDARALNPATVRLEFNFSLDLLRLFPTTLVGAQNDDGPGLPAPLNATPHRRANRLTQHPTAGMLFWLRRRATTASKLANRHQAGAVHAVSLNVRCAPMHQPVSIIFWSTVTDCQARQTQELQRSVSFNWSME